MHHPSDQRTQTRRSRPATPVLVQQRTKETVDTEARGHEDLAAALEEAHREITTLKAGLERRTIIGEAVGIMMIQTGIAADAAFARLVDLSQDTNVRVRDIAEQMVEEANRHASGLARAHRLPKP